METPLKGCFPSLARSRWVAAKDLIGDISYEAVDDHMCMDQGNVRSIGTREVDRCEIRHLFIITPSEPDSHP